MDCIIRSCRTQADKRKQLVYGIRLAQTPIVVFSDDDAVWTPAMLDYILGSFEDPSMGGVNTSQRMMPCNPNGRISAWEILADMRLSLRTVEAAASTYIDGGVSCLSGRTAAYRRIIVADPAFEEGFLNDYWLGMCYRLDVYHPFEKPVLFGSRLVATLNVTDASLSCAVQLLVRSLSLDVRRRQVPDALAG